MGTTENIGHDIPGDLHETRDNPIPSDFHNISFTPFTKFITRTFILPYGPCVSDSSGTVHPPRYPHALSGEHLVGSVTTNRTFGNPTSTAL